LLTNGHILLEGVPGLAKTLALKTLAGAIHGARFGRIPIVHLSGQARPCLRQPRPRG
jgi:MoxR-like ATPase